MIRSLPRERLDRIVAVGLGVAAAADAGLLQPGDHPAAAALLSFVLCLPLGWRRRFPIAAPALPFVVGVAQNLVVGSIEGSAVAIFVVIIAAYSPGAYADGRRAVAGLGLCLLGMSCVRATFPGPLRAGEIVWTCAVVTAAWLAGRAVRTRTRMTEELHEAALHAEDAREAGTREAVAEERRRIAREMHDIVAHSVSVMVVQAGGARRILDRDVRRAVEAAGRIEDTGRAALLEMRRLLGILSAGEDGAHHAPQPTLDALEALVAGARTAGLPVALRIEGERGALPPGVDLAAYRVIQEAITNALKHAGAAPTDVCVRYGADDVELEVADRGPGHRLARRRGEAQPLAGGGHGLVGVRERVRVFGGELSTGPRPGGGFAVWARIPLYTEAGPSPAVLERRDADLQHQSAGLDAPRGLERPEADRQHQSAGLDAPRR
jgi:signal transduction histidine kinase